MLDVVTRLTLTDFRNYPSLRLDLDANLPFIVLTGPNGAGKTNILEAVSLMAPGRGLRGAGLRDLAGRSGATRPGLKPWAVSARLWIAGEERQAGTGVDQAEAGRRIVRLDGQAEASTAALGEDWSILWLTPQMDRLFAEGPSARRRFLDRLTLALYPDHGRQVSSYEKAMRERNRILGDQGMAADPLWLSALEARIATHGVAVAAARTEMVAALEAIQTDRRAFPSLFIDSRMMLDGPLELAIKAGQAPSDIEADFCAQLEAARRSDAQGGRQGIGPHKTDLVVTHFQKSITADLCSTGEQKALLLSLILNQAHLIAHLRGRPPFLLLDEVAAHLDDQRRTALFDHLRTLGTQIWVTGTEAEIFHTLPPDGQFFRVEDGVVTPA